MERWQLIFLAVVWSGLLIGWLSNQPFVGLAVIWGALIMIEALSLRRSRKKQVTQ